MIDPLRCTVVLLTCFVAGSGALFAEVPAEPPVTAGAGPTSIQAVYKLQEVSFQYRSAVAVYSCGALKDRVASILRAMGARDDVEVRVDDCFSSMMPPEPISTPYPSDPTDPWGSRRTSRLTNPMDDRQQTVFVRIKAMWPTEVTPQILAEMKKDASRRDLISRVTGNPAARLNDPVLFPAARQRFTLSHKTIGLDPIECELLDQLSSGVFRKLDVRVVSRSMLCDRDGRSHIPPQMTVETLAPLPIGAVQLPSMGDEEEETPAPESK